MEVRNHLWLLFLLGSMLSQNLLAEGHDEYGNPVTPTPRQTAPNRMTPSEIRLIQTANAWNGVDVQSSIGEQYRGWMDKKDESGRAALAVQFFKVAGQEINALVGWGDKKGKLEAFQESRISELGEKKIASDPTYRAARALLMAGEAIQKDETVERLATGNYDEEERGFLKIFIPLWKRDKAERELMIKEVLEAAKSGQRGKMEAFTRKYSFDRRSLFKWVAEGLQSSNPTIKNIAGAFGFVHTVISSGKRGFLLSSSSVPLGFLDTGDTYEDFLKRAEAVASNSPKWWLAPLQKNLPRQAQAQAQCPANDPIACIANNCYTCHVAPTVSFNGSFSSLELTRSDRPGQGPWKLSDVVRLFNTTQMGGVPQEVQRTIRQWASMQ